MKSFVQRWGPRGGQLLLTLTAVVGALCAVVALLAVVLGVRPIVFRSGSMSPAVETGALGFSRNADAADLKVGDIVTVTNAQKKTITHRIVAIGPGDRSATLRLKGDDNPVPDDEIYTVSAVPKLWFSIPEGGYVIAWFSKAPGSYLLGGYVVLMLMLAFRRRRDSDSGGETVVAERVEPEPIRVAPIAHVSPVPQARPTIPATPVVPKTRRRKMVAALGAGAVVAVAAAVVSGWSQSTWAAWNDDVAVTGTTITTGAWGVVPAAPSISCSKSGNNYTISWPAVSGATSYTVSWYSTSNTQLSQTVSASPVVLNPVFGPNGGHPIFVTANNGSGSSASSNVITSC